MVQLATRRPPLDIVALFKDDIPAGLDWAVEAAPPFDARRLDPPFAPFTGHFSDSFQPLTSEERTSAESARAGLALRCVADAPPDARLPAAITLMRRCYAHGAVAIVLPVAQKIIGPLAMMVLAPQLDSVAGWLKLFLQLYTIYDEQYAWSHTHGMEHLCLPDLECRTALAEAAMGEAAHPWVHSLPHRTWGREPSKTMTAWCHASGSIHRASLRTMNTAPMAPCNSCPIRGRAIPRAISWIRVRS